MTSNSHFVCPPVAPAEAKSQEPDAVAVKPLEWADHEGDGVMVADAVTGEYRVRCRGGDLWVVARDGIPLSNRPYELARFAKAAAQADYEHRIRSAFFTRGMCPSNRDFTEWCAEVDKLLPPLPCEAAIRADEREKCAKIAGDRGWMGRPYPGFDIAEAIRNLKAEDKSAVCGKEDEPTIGGHKAFSFLHGLVSGNINGPTQDNLSSVIHWAFAEISQLRRATIRNGGKQP